MRSTFVICQLLVLASSTAFASMKTWPAAGDTLAPATTVPSYADILRFEGAYAHALADSFQVCEIDLELEVDSNAVSRQLWDLLQVSELSKRYSELQVPSGNSVWSVFRSGLLATAKSNGFEYASLERAFGDMEKQKPFLTTRGLLVPFAAYLAHRAGEPVWVILSRWGGVSSSQREGSPTTVQVRHVQAWAFLAQTGEQIGYTTCK